MTVTFSENVTVTGSPQLELAIGSNNRTAEYESTGGSTAVFSYTVAEGDSDDDGIAINANKLTLNGGGIKDAANNDADLAHNALTAQDGHKVDSVKPTFRSLSLSQSSDGSDGFYQVDDELLVRVTFSEQVIVNGTPQLTLVSMAKRQKRPRGSVPGMETTSPTRYRRVTRTVTGCLSTPTP